MLLDKKLEFSEPFLKMPPHSVESEESILSSILIGGRDNLNEVGEVLGMLVPEDFYKISHRVIFAVILSLYHRGDPTDLITVVNMLRNKNFLEKIGGATYIARLIETAPVAINIKHYAKIVRSKAILRSLINKSYEISIKCHESNDNVESVLDFAEKSIYELSNRLSYKSITSIGESIRNNINVLEERQANKSISIGIPTGFSDLDRLTSGLQNSDLIIVAARPAMGKTAFALNVARNAALLLRKTVVIFSLEMSKDQLSMRMLCSEAKVDVSKFRKSLLTQEDWLNITDAASKLTDIPIYIDDSSDITISSIKTKSRHMKMEEDLGLVIVDYLQLMHSNAKFERRDLEISDISRSLKMLAKELDIPILGLSQLNRKVEERNNKRPQLSDLRESGALEQDADVVMFIYREEMYNPELNDSKKGTAEIIVSKQRNGPTGYTVLNFIDFCTKFEDLYND